MTVSLIISTYNSPDTLAVCLDSVLRQSRMPDEIIIGDDGSTADTAMLVKEFAARCPVPVEHLWHNEKTNPHLQDAYRYIKSPFPNFC